MKQRAQEQEGREESAAWSHPNSWTEPGGTVVLLISYSETPERPKHTLTAACFPERASWRTVPSAALSHNHPSPGPSPSPGPKNEAERAAHRKVTDDYQRQEEEAATLHHLTEGLPPVALELLLDHVRLDLATAGLDVTPSEPLTDEDQGGVVVYLDDDAQAAGDWLPYVRLDRAALGMVDRQAAPPSWAEPHTVSALERQTAAMWEPSAGRCRRPDVVPDDAPAPIEQARAQAPPGRETQAAALRRAPAQRAGTPVSFRSGNGPHDPRNSQVRLAARVCRPGSRATLRR